MANKVIRIAILLKKDDGSVVERFIDVQKHPNAEVIVQTIEVAIQHGYADLDDSVWQEQVVGT
jgi:hypothetical protein